MIHLVAELRVSGQTPGHHFTLDARARAAPFNRHMDFPVAWPADAGTRDRGSGEPIRIYKQFGLRMMAEPATRRRT